MALLFTLLFRCGLPATSILPDLLGNPHCHVNWPTIYPLAVVMSTVNSASYLIIVVVPALIVFQKASLSTGARTSVIVLFGLAVVGLGISIARCFFMHYIFVGPTFWRRLGVIWILSATETTIGTTIISLATLKSLAICWKHRLGRTIAHLRGHEYSRDSINVRMMARSTLVPTTNYHDMEVDERVLCRIGVLPGIDEDIKKYVAKPSTKVYYMSQTVYMPSISEIMFDSNEATRRLSTV